MSFYRFFQKEEDGVWHPIQDSADVVEAAKREGAKKLTILAVNKPLGAEDAKRGNSYKGPLYFDIDSSEGLKHSIESARLLVNKLLETYETPRQALSIYLSGKKGFHVIVDQRAFMQRRVAVKDLPLIYKLMATELFVSGLDLSPYAVGRNNTFRIANLKRYDGNYRVPCTVEELAEMTPERYVELVAAPRAHLVFADYDGDCSVKLQLLYASASEKLARMDKELTSRTRDLAQGELAKIADHAPPCIDELCSGKGHRQGASFNDIALNVALWASRAQVPEMERERVIHLIADNMEASDRYPTARARITELESKYRYTLHSPEYKFGCNAMRALAKRGRQVCAGCPLEGGACAKGSQFYTDMAEQLGLSQNETGYIRVHKKGMIEHISTFTMHAEAVYMEPATDGTGGFRRKGTLCALHRHGEVLGRVIMSEESWGSKSSFLRELQGIQGVYYTGGDVDVQKIKMLVFSEEENMPEIYQVNAVGIHIERQGATEIVTYVENGHSLNNLNMVDTHKLTTGKPPKQPAHYFTTSAPAPGNKELDRALTEMCAINDKSAVAIMVGWFAACHLKAHLMRAFVQFPLLSLWGGTGAGKSKTVELLGHLCGMNLSVDRAENVAGINRFNAIELLSSSTTIPRVCEEYNRKNMAAENYAMLGELFKGVWGGEMVSRGEVLPGRSQAVSRSIQLSAPVVIQSEQEIKMPALQERTLILLLRKDTQNKRAYMEASSRREMITQFGLVLMQEALRLQVKDVQAMYMAQYDNVSEDEWDDRPAYSLRVVHMGLDWLAKVSRKSGLNNASFAFEELKIHLEGITGSGLSGKQRTLRAGRPQSEVDQLVGVLNDLAAESGAVLMDMLERGAHVPSRRIMLNPRTDWRVAGDELFLLPKVVHSRYAEHMKATGQSARLGDLSDFLKLVENESYFIAWRKLPDFGFGDNVLVLSLSELTRRNVGTSALIGVYDKLGTVQLEW